MEKKGFAIASLVLGIVAIVSGCAWYVAIPCAIVGLILGIMANKVKKTGMATAGIVLSIIALVLAVLVIAGLGALLDVYKRQIKLRLSLCGYLIKRIHHYAEAMGEPEFLVDIGLGSRVELIFGNLTRR